MTTNAKSSLLAAILADAKLGTFTGLITAKVGTVKGGIRYGDDTVHTVILTGFRYPSLVQRSLALLPSVDAEDVIRKCADRGHVVTATDVEQARAELAESYAETLAGTSESTTDHVFDPLTVDGEAVRGSRVYKCVAGQADKEGKPYDCKCRNCTGDEKAPLPGTVYLTGLRIWSEVLVPAKNGPATEPKSAAKTLAKNEIARRLPISRLVSYRLEPGQDWILRAGGTAAVEATDKGFIVTDEIVDVLKKAA